MIRYQRYIKRADLVNNPQWLYVFGDNMVRRGLGGQAKEMRGEPNAVGIITKRFPSMSEGAFLTDKDYDEWVRMSKSDIARLEGHDGVVIWPANGVGTGLANLMERAPRIYGAIKELEYKMGPDFL